MLPCKVQAAHLAEAVIQIDGQKQKGKIKIDVQIRARYILAKSLGKIDGTTTKRAEQRA
jgi:hypothetical protein